MIARLLGAQGPHPFSGARRAPVTKKHRPLIWENMLGTVYARSPQGETRYFDYDWTAARAFAQVAHHTDLRLARNRQPAYGDDYQSPRLNQLVLYGVPR